MIVFVRTCLTQASDLIPAQPVSERALKSKNYMPGFHAEVRLWSEIKHDILRKYLTFIAEELEKVINEQKVTIIYKLSLQSLVTSARNPLYVSYVTCSPRS